VRTLQSRASPAVQYRNMLFEICLTDCPGIPIDHRLLGSTHLRSSGFSVSVNPPPACSAICFMSGTHASTILSLNGVHRSSIYTNIQVRVVKVDGMIELRRPTSGPRATHDKVNHPCQLFSTLNGSNISGKQPRGSPWCKIPLQSPTNPG
jgi:hypothetical protein